MREIPKDLPMPTYHFQQPDHASFVAPYKEAISAPKKTLLADLTDICDTIEERWDKDMRSGKLLLALMGTIDNYDPRVTRIRAALKSLDDAGV